MLKKKKKKKKKKLKGWLGVAQLNLTPRLNGDQTVKVINEPKLSLEY
jgi:hypothetical protein